MNGYSDSSRLKDNQPFPGKIAVITSTTSISGDAFRSAQGLLEKYGPDKIIHYIWPDNFMDEQKQTLDTLIALASDKDIKVLILNQALPGSNAAVEKLKETRDDIFIVYCTIHESPAESARHANLILTSDELGMGQAMVKQAKKQGAKTFVHYSFPRHLSQPDLSASHDIIQEECEKEGILFVGATALDHTGAAGVTGARQFILDDVPKLVAKYGEDTAFYSSACPLQKPLIKSVVDCHAIYPQPCCPSPFHGFPEALGIETDDNQDDLSYVINEASRIAADKNMTDRLSTWPVSASMMFTNAGAEYAIKWINGKVPRDGIDDEILEKCMSSYIKEVVGEGIEVSISSYSENGVTYDNFKLLLMGYLDF